MRNSTSSDIHIGVAGDWHGNLPWAVRCVETMADAGVSEIYHLGDVALGRGGRPVSETEIIDLIEAGPRDLSVLAWKVSTAISPSSRCLTALRTRIRWWTG